MLPGDLIDAPVQRAAEPEVVRVQRQDLVVPDRVQRVVGQSDVDAEQRVRALPQMAVADHRGAVDDSEHVGELVFLADEVGPDTGGEQPLDRQFQQPILLAAFRPVREPDQIRGAQMNAAGQLLAAIAGGHHRGAAVDQNILVEDGREAAAAGLQLQPVAVAVLVAADLVRRPRREAEERMLQVGYQLLQRGRQQIDCEQVRLVAVRGDVLAFGHGGSIASARLHVKYTAAK